MRMELQADLDELRRKKDELLRKSLETRDELQKFQTSLLENKNFFAADFMETLQSQNSSETLSQERKSVKKLTSTTRNVVGLTFVNVTKKWLRDHVWLYEMQVVAKVLQFKLALTLNKEELKKNEILDITCYLTNIDECCTKEITPWVASLTRTKNFTHLMSAFSEYNEQSVIRKVILSKMKNEMIVTAQKCVDEGGGLIAYVHHPENVDNPYLKIYWRLKLNLRTTSIDHNFQIDGLNEGFIEANENLLKKFCKSELKITELESLWGSLHEAVTKYEA